MRYELSDHEWSVIRVMLPTKSRGKPRVDDRRVLNGIFWVLRSGAPWRDLPDIYGPRTTCYNRFVRWRRSRGCGTSVGSKRRSRGDGKTNKRASVPSSRMRDANAWANCVGVEMPARENAAGAAGRAVHPWTAAIGLADKGRRNPHWSAHGGEAKCSPCKSGRLTSCAARRRIRLPPAWLLACRTQLQFVLGGPTGPLLYQRRSACAATCGRL